jgi:hypothetical protein
MLTVPPPLQDLPSMTTIAKPAPLGDATNVQKTAGEMDASMKERVLRTHIKFDDDGNPAQTTVTEVDHPEAEEQAEPAEEAEQTATEEAGADAADADAEGEEVDPDAAAKKHYRDVPSLFNTEKERTATWAGKHTRFPEDEDGEDNAPEAPLSEEMQSKIDQLSSAISSSMVVESK